MNSFLCNSLKTSFFIFHLHPGSHHLIRSKLRRPLGKDMAIHSSILPRKIPGTEETLRLQSMVLQRVKTWLRARAHTHTHTHTHTIEIWTKNTLILLSNLKSTEFKEILNLTNSNVLLLKNFIKALLWFEKYTVLGPTSIKSQAPLLRLFGFWWYLIETDSFKNWIHHECSQGIYTVHFVM